MIYRGLVPLTPGSNDPKLLIWINNGVLAGKRFVGKIILIIRFS